MKLHYLLFLLFIIILSCNEGSREKEKEQATVDIFQILETAEDTLPEPLLPDTIIDAAYTFDEALKDSEAPESIISQLELLDVFYISTDGNIHKGQIVTNKLITDDIIEIFRFMLDEGFVIEKAVPIVRYGWNDSLSMADNNSYSFCYRNITYSKHAEGMAIDINPKFNPLIGHNCQWHITPKSPCC